MELRCSIAIGRIASRTTFTATRVSNCENRASIGRKCGFVGSMDPPTDWMVDPVFAFLHHDACARAATVTRHHPGIHRDDSHNVCY